jgi:hypothetical protein
LPPPDRITFRRAAEDALARVPCWGEIAAYRAVAALQQRFLDPLTFALRFTSPPLPLLSAPCQKPSLW